MKFHILKLIVWPKSLEFAPREVTFQPGKLNVITGASRTGKSAIIPIIDYCLASSDCYIPIDTIRDYSSWYGLIFETDHEQVLIARKVPTGNKVSNEFYISRGPIVSTPKSIDSPNEKLDGIKNILNTIAFVPYFALDTDDERKGYKARLGFRDLMALVFQTQDIVANQNILFYKTHAHEHRERLRNWFPYILGAENLEVLIARQRLADIDKRLAQLKKEFEKAKAVSESWMANMNGHIQIAKEYGLLTNVLSQDGSPEELLATARYVVDNIPDHTLSNSESITTASKELDGLTTREDELSSKIALVKRRLADLNKLKGGLIDYSESVAKRANRLHISQWLENIGSESQTCPTCGSAEHPHSSTEIKKVAQVYKKLEDESKKIVEIPSSFAREEETLNSELRKYIEEKSALQNRFDVLVSTDAKFQNDFQQRKNMFIFLGHLKSSIETFEKLIEGGNSQQEMDDLEIEYHKLMRIADPSGVKRRVEIAETEISQNMVNHLKDLDVDDKYRRIPPKFSIENLNISVLSDDDHWHFLAEVGSASNWVSFHIALLCSLQEQFIGLKKSSVPSFVIFDQPSQVYFPKLKRGEGLAESLNYDSDEDVAAVKSMFKTIVNSIIGQNRAWQAIILDHADSSIYGDIENVHEVEIWRGGNKLIPEAWYAK
jgi:hypothetical protein